jgi:hypothetical protein
VTRQQIRFERRKGARVAGFVPSFNKRIAAAFLAELAQLDQAGVDALRADVLARLHVGRMLPPLPAARRHKWPKPSKSDFAAYRKQAVAA